MKMKWIYFVLVFVPVHTHFNNSSTDNSTPCTDQNHLFLAPGVLTAGGTNRACVSRFYPEGVARMIITLVAENQTYTASRDLPSGDGGCLDISVPLLPNIKADLVLNLWYEAPKCSWERRIPVRIASGRLVSVYTERARYRPGETLKARVIALKADLTPAPGNIEEIWVEGPPGAWEGTRVAEWLRVRGKMGLAQVQHQLDDLAPPGRWTLKARLADGSQGSSVFWVGNYELPPFQLTVRHAPRVLRTSERLVWTVCVRYPWTEAVEGMLVIRLRASSVSSGVHTVVRVRSPRACHRHAAAAARVGLADASIVVADFSFQEEGTRVWQNTTVVSQVVDKPITIQFVTKPGTVISPGLPYKLKVKATRWDDKPATDTGVRVCRSAMTQTNATCASADTDGIGVARVMFAAEDHAATAYRFEASLSNDSTVTTGPLTLSTRGSNIQAALGPLRADPRGSRTFVPLYLSLHNVTTPVTVHFVVITRGGIIYRWGATTQCPIASSATHVQAASRNTKCNDPMPQYDQDTDKNGNTVYENTKTDRTSNLYDTKRNNQNPDAVGNDFKRSRNYDRNTNQYVADKIPKYNQNKNSEYIRNMNEFDINSYLNRNAHNKNNSVDKKTVQIFDRYSSVVVQNIDKSVRNNVNNTQYEDNVSDSLLDRHLLRVMLPIKVTQQMCPDSHLIAYFYYNGEFVSASKHFELDDCFVNNVEVTFLPRQTLPGSTATLHITTPGPALCALTALDTAAKWGSTTVREVLMQGLRRMIDGHRNMTEFDATGDCEAESPQLTSLQQTAAWLAAAGVRTGDVAYNACDPPAMLVDEANVPRTDFSEAWLWRVVGVSSEGAATVSAATPHSVTRYDAAAVCISKTGVAVSHPTVLQVFREFFIHADCAKRLRQGDSTVLRYRIFNYLYEPLGVEVQLLSSSNLHIESSVQSICVPPRSSIGGRAALEARGAGTGTVTVRAAGSTRCGNYTGGRGISDGVVMKITVDPEGIPVQEHKSILLCGKDSTKPKSDVSWSWAPKNPVPGTETLTVWATWDLMGPLLADSDALVQSPRGCGEQNMARLATNLLALTLLAPHCSAALAARQHVARGFTRQLQYIHPSGGFSAFGSSDPTASTWLTAFSLRYMKKAHRVLWPNKPLPPALDRAEKWLLEQQMENGCFRNEGQVFHRELRGGLNEEGEIASVALTAYVITSLLDSLTPTPTHSYSYSSSISSRVVRNTLSCLRALPPMKYKTPTRVYAHALLAYAFMSIEKYENDVRRYNEVNQELRVNEKYEQQNPAFLKKNEGVIEIMELVKMAKTDGDYMWWETSSLSTSIEATSYALLALQCGLESVREWGAGAVRWLASHRGATGGFVSTQDTLVALEALTAWSSLQPSSANLSVSVTSGSLAKSGKITAGDRIPEVFKMEGDKVHVGVEGTGCALVQATRAYHSLGVSSGGRLRVTVTVHPDGTFNCDATETICYCAAIIETCVIWSGSFPEMCLLEVSLPGGYGADAAKLYSQLHQPDSLLRRIELTPSNSRATLYLGSPEGPLPSRGHSCVTIHAVGPRAHTRPAYVRLLDYYNPDNNDTQFYTIPEDCPSRITHEYTQDLTSDNIFQKAKSLKNDGEILMTQEYSYEDIPEGIPLEDPLYENLTAEDKDLINIDTKQESNSRIEDGSEISVQKNIGDINTREQTKPIAIDDKLDISSTMNKSHNFSQKPSASKFNTPDVNNRSMKMLNENDTQTKGVTNKELTIRKEEMHEKDTNESHQNMKESTTEIASETIKADRDEIKEDIHVENPNLSNFHVIDSEKDLEVPSGLEGPVAVVVLPPPNFVPQNYETKEDFRSLDHFKPAETDNFQPTQHFEPKRFEQLNFGPVNKEFIRLEPEHFKTRNLNPQFVTVEPWNPRQSEDLIQRVSRPHNYNPAHNNFETIQNIRESAKFRLEPDLGPIDNFRTRTTQNFRLPPNFGLPSNNVPIYRTYAQNLRTTEIYAPRNFVTQSYHFRDTPNDDAVFNDGRYRSQNPYVPFETIQERRNYISR